MAHVCVPDFPLDRVPLVLSCLLYPDSYEIPNSKLVPDSDIMAKLVSLKLLATVFIIHRL